MPEVFIETQAILDNLLNSVDWDDAFIREVYAISPTYKKADGIIAPNAIPDIKVLIITPHSQCAGVEFVFERVSDLSIAFRNELSPFGQVKYHNSYIDFGFSRYQIDIRAERGLYTLLDEAINGDKRRYSNE